MNRIEDRLRDAFGAAAGTVRPETIRGLRGRPASSPRRRPLAPLAAAAAVAVVIAAVFLIAPLVLSGHQNAATLQAPAPHRWPMGRSSSSGGPAAVMPSSGR